jgi:hypothetical protein
MGHLAAFNSHLFLTQLAPHHKLGLFADEVPSVSAADFFMRNDCHRRVCPRNICSRGSEAFTAASGGCNRGSGECASRLRRARSKHLCFLLS